MAGCSNCYCYYSDFKLVPEHIQARTNSTTLWRNCSSGVFSFTHAGRRSASRSEHTKLGVSSFIFLVVFYRKSAMPEKKTRKIKQHTQTMCRQKSVSLRNLLLLMHGHLINVSKYETNFAQSLGIYYRELFTNCSGVPKWEELYPNKPHMTKKHSVRRICFRQFLPDRSTMCIRDACLCPPGAQHIPFAYFVAWILSFFAWHSQHDTWTVYSRCTTQFLRSRISEM